MVQTMRTPITARMILLCCILTIMALKTLELVPRSWSVSLKRFLDRVKTSLWNAKSLKTEAPMCSLSVNIASPCSSFLPALSSVSVLSSNLSLASLLLEPLKYH